MDRPNAVPGSRPLAFWHYEAPDAPQLEDEDDSADQEDFDVAQLRYLAERGLLRDDEIAQLAADARATNIDESGQERNQRRFEAVLDGLSRHTNDDQEVDQQ